MNRVVGVDPAELAKEECGRAEAGESGLEQVCPGERGEEEPPRADEGGERGAEQDESAGEDANEGLGFHIRI